MPKANETFHQAPPPTTPLQSRHATSAHRNIHPTESSPLIGMLSWRLKRLSYLAQRTRASLALRGWRGTWTRIQRALRPAPASDDTLDLLPLDAPFAPFDLPVSDSPQVSIVIPIYGKLAWTLACLRSIARHGANATFEVIVVDDASPDDGAEKLAQVTGVRLVRNTENLGFVGSCNAGTAVARGEFLLFLNNDTQVTPGWLDALLACFAERADCGIAGSRLIYPDGRLQEAGALAFADGSGWNLGRFESRYASTWRVRREVDYVSGAALMIRRATFGAIDGFDTRYSPGYYEDTDLAFAVRKLGQRVYVVPTSTVIHCEGISAGTDPNAGMKRFQHINQAKFASKWHAELEAQPPVGTPLARAIRWRRHGRILIVDAMTPDATRDSGSVRLIAIMRILRDEGWDVTFRPDDGRVSDAELATLGALGCEVIAAPETRSLPAWLNKHGSSLAAVMLCRHTVAGQYAALVRKHAPQAKLLFDTVDLHFLREHRAARLAHSAVMRRQAGASRHSELAIIKKADVTFVVSRHERTLLRKLVPGAHVELLSNIHEVHEPREPHAGRRDLLFIGGAGHPPNVDAMRWIASDILPTLRKELPGWQVHIVGDVPDALRTELATPGLIFHGRVPDLAPWMNTCLASIAPLRFGAGVKGKINTAMSYGLPVIATALAVEGMQLANGRDVLVVDNGKGYAAAARQLLDNAALWAKLSLAGVVDTRDHFSATAAADTLGHVLGHGVRPA